MMFRVDIEFDGQDWAEQGPEIDVADFAAAFATADTRMKTRPGARSVNIIRLITDPGVLASLK
jgi:hypothetical protein